MKLTYTEISKKVLALGLLAAFLCGQTAEITAPLHGNVASQEREPVAVETSVEGNDAIVQMATDKLASSDIHQRQTGTSGSSSQEEASNYVIEAGDVLEIVVLGEEDLTRTMMVMHNGTISFPLVGELKVAGLTTEQAAAYLIQKLRRYYTHPVVSIVLKSPTLPHVSVFGQVSRQGAVEYQRGLRLTDYIALAGGPTGRANLGKVRVVRFVNEKPVVSEVDVNEILVQGRTSQNVELKSGDWVYVPERFTFNWSTILSTLTLAVAVMNLYITYTKLE
jgi:polysaccharide export outer membrane protein